MGGVVSTLNFNIIPSRSCVCTYKPGATLNKLVLIIIIIVIMTAVSRVSRYDFLYQKISCKRPIDIPYNIIYL